MTEEFYSRDLPSGLTISVIPLTFGRARIHIGPTRSMFYLDGW